MRASGAADAVLGALVVAVAMLLRVWRLHRHGWDNLYYAAAALSMSRSWHNFWYAAFDPGGFLAIGKPPLAFWIQALAVRAFGFHALTIHLPQAVAGVLSVLLVFRLARRVTGPGGAGLAALTVALTPASVAADRSNLPDSWVVLLLLSACGLVLDARDRGDWRRLLLGSALVGLAFLAKFMVAFLVLPAFFVTYGLTAPVSTHRRLVHLGAASVVVAGVSLWWPVMVDVTPPQVRPRIAETDDNSVLSLALGRQGVSRLAGGGGPGGVGGAPISRWPTHGASPGPGGILQGVPAGSGWAPRTGRELHVTGHGGPPGFRRLVRGELAGQISWFFPLIVAGFGGFAVWGADVLLWASWLLTAAAVFSLAPTFVHPYYLAVLAPSVGVLVGMVAGRMGHALEHGGRSSLLVAGALALTLCWHLVQANEYPPWGRLLVPLLGGMGVVSVGGILGGATARMRRAAFVLGATGLMVCPALWAATPALAPMGRMVPMADPAVLEYHRRVAGMGMEPTALPALVRFLCTHRAEERFLLAVPDVHWAAPIILHSGEAVMAFGGFTGTEDIIDAGGFARTVGGGHVRFVLLPGNPARMGEHGVERWVRRHATLVPSQVWNPEGHGARTTTGPLPPWGPTEHMVAFMFGELPLELYDCRPELGWLAPLGTRGGEPSGDEPHAPGTSGGASARG